MVDGRGSHSPDPSPTNPWAPWPLIPKPLGSPRFVFKFPGHQTLRIVDPQILSEYMSPPKPILQIPCPPGFLDTLLLRYPQISSNSRSSYYFKNLQIPGHFGPQIPGTLGPSATILMLISHLLGYTYLKHLFTVLNPSADHFFFVLIL